MDYILKGIDRSFWKRVKLFALKHDVSVKDLILHCLEEKIKEYDMIINHNED